MTDSAAPTHHEHTVGDLTLATLEWGDPEAPLALLLHGYPDTAWTWRHLGPRLAARGWHAVAPFSRGYAPSGLAPDGRYFISDLAADAVGLRDQLGAGRPAALVSHDWGAVTGWFINHRAPGAFDAYVMVAIPPPAALLTAPRGPGGVGRTLRQSRMSWYFAYNQLPRAGAHLDTLIPRLWQAWSPGYDGAEDVALVMAALDSTERREAALGYYRDNLRRGLRTLLSTRASAPALLLHGVEDGCIDPGVARAGAALMVDGSRYESVPAGGHFLHLDQPDVVGALVEDWLASGV